MSTNNIVKKNSLSNIFKKKYKDDVEALLTPLKPKSPIRI